MASSAVTGERRWTSVRRGGMTVLGKVAVPKPINLPSQRSENHGLDPNVEIVPKGTLSWGSRSSSSSTSNAWGSSTLSPNTDGGTGSPSHLSARPSSGGSGTRPSTAGSDRAAESSGSAWGPTSRPSSASGALTSNQTAGTLRPRSAEPRPGSSQLSRFAESSPDTSVVWTGAGTIEKLGGAFSKKDGFALTSGDFPTLGSEKNSSGKDSQENGVHSRPGSSSSVAAPAKGDASSNVNEKNDTVDSWRNCGSPYAEGAGGVQPGVEQWQGGPHPYPNASIPPQHFDSWHGTPMGGPPGGVWFRGPPYGAPVPPGGFPMEPYPYYRPQVSPTLVNSQPGLAAAPAPRGHHPNSGDMYRPQIPEAYIRPGVAMRPAFYHGPVPYEGYYAPPVGYCNPIERDVPFMGMAAGSPVYNRYPGQNAPDPGNPHARFGGSGSTGTPGPPEQLGSVHPHDNQRPGKVLLKQHNAWNGRDERQKWEHPVANNVPYHEKEEHLRASSWENDWEGDQEKVGVIKSGVAMAGEHVFSNNMDNQGSLSCAGNQKLAGSLVESKAADGHSASILEVGTSPPEAPQLFPAHEKDSTLIQKIEGLNAKARASDGWYDASSASHKEDESNRLDEVKARGICDASAVNGASANRRANNGIQGRNDHRGRPKFNSRDIDGFRKKPLVVDASNVVVTSNSEQMSNRHVQDQKFSAGALEKSSHLQQLDEGESVAPVFDPSDGQAKRAKMRELAKQKAKQLQEEEEERTREQKAKAHAKLEELNRRTQAAEGFTQKLENNNTNNSAQVEQAERTVDASKSGVITTDSVSKADVAEITKNKVPMVEQPGGMSRKFPVEMKNTLDEPSVTQNQSLPLIGDHSNSSADVKTTQEVHNRQKRTSYKQKQVSHSESPTDLSVSIDTAEVPRHTVVDNASAPTEIVKGDTSSTHKVCLPTDPVATAESSLPQRRKNNRGNKNKQRLDETSAVADSSLPVSKGAYPVKTSPVSDKAETFGFESETRSSQSTDSKEKKKYVEQQALLGEEGCTKVNKQWKPQYSRRSTQNMKEKLHSGDSVVWAPVRSQNKVEAADEVSRYTTSETASESTKSSFGVHSGPKGKRADLERYVPKPVAKELSKQGSSQQMASPLDPMRPDEVAGVQSALQSTANTPPSSSEVGKVKYAVNTKGGQVRQNKQGKAHGSWRQRTSEDPTHVESSVDGSPSDLSTNAEKPMEHMKPVADLSEEKPQYYDEWNPPDGWNNPSYQDSATSVTLSSVKDVGAVGKGKRQSFRGQKVTGNNPEYDRTRSHIRVKNMPHTQSSSLDEMSQVDGVTAIENRGTSERSMSQWQPKSQTNSSQNVRGTRPSGGPKERPIIEHHGKVMGEYSDKADYGQNPSRTSIIEEAPIVGYQDARRERRAPPFKGHTNSPKHGARAESASSTNTDIIYEQHSSSGFHKNGNQNGRFAREREFHGDWSSVGQDNRQHYAPANKERVKPNSHYEYQPVGPQNYSKSNSSEGRADGPQYFTSSRGRDGGQSHSRRNGGNSYGRQGRNGRVGTGYD